MGMNSSTARGHRALARVSAAEAEVFLLDVANLRIGDNSDLSRFERRFGRFLPPPMEAAVDIKTDNELPWAWAIQEAVRPIWLAPDLRIKQWGVFKFSYEVMQHTNRRFASEPGALPKDKGVVEKLPPPTPLEQILLHLLKSADRLRYCKNPECPAPYFFAKRRSQKYCADVCALPAQREFKRLWWAHNGKQWRRLRSRRATGKRAR